ncbi:MAG TPA: DUF952 domain-containing protein, partial [Chloroflexia bacterium]|nr:DUF952 domain-containing protein [Chloroflexia bacterium]
MSVNSDKLSGTTFHMVPKEYYEAQPTDSDYLPEPMKAGREQFIHCTDGTENLAATGNRYYTADPREYIVLVINLAKLKAPVRYEDPNHIYPHIYGPLNRDAIE